MKLINQSIIFCNILLSFFLASCHDNKGEVLCDFENTTEKEGELFFVKDDLVFKSGQLKSSDYARSGMNSIRLDSTNKYGGSTILTDISKGEYIQISVWKKKLKNSQGKLIMAVDDNLTLIGKEVSASDSDWSLQTLDFRAVRDFDSINVFLAHTSGVEVYFDDLKINRSSKPMEPEDSFEKIELFLPDSSKNKLDKLVQDLLFEEYIPEQAKESFNGFILNNSDSSDISIRLKGDFTDHLRTGFPSYRIKTESDDRYFKGIRTFSLQHPKTRNFQHEWLIHQLLEHENILTTRYFFLPLYINHEYAGVYAFEEHFEKQLVESKENREGPILKFDETAFWELAQINYLNETSIRAPFYRTSQVIPFKSKINVVRPLSSLVALLSNP